MSVLEKIRRHCGVIVYIFYWNPCSGKEFEILGHDVLVIIDGLIVLCNKWAKWDGGGPQTLINYMAVKAYGYVISQPTEYYTRGRCL